MLDQTNRTFVGSVLFLDIVEYSKKSVSEQLKLKQRFNALLSQALEHIAPGERIILDTGDGAAINFLGDPEEALFVAAALRDAIPGPEDSNHMPVRIGINLGPVRLMKDINGQLNIIGDGINVAQRVMSFSRPGQILASRSYYEVVSRLSEDYAPLFSYQGSRTDKHVREHEVYAVGATNPALRSAFSPPPTGARAAAAPPSNRRLLLAVPLTFTLIVGAGVLFRMLTKTAVAEAPLPVIAALQASAAAPAAAPREPAPALPAGAAIPAPVVRPAISTKPARPTTPQAEAKAETKTEIKAERPAPALVTLAVLPWGEVFVDGKSRGVSPPLKILEIDAGQHVVEVRNTTFPNHLINISVKPGEKIRVQHKFQ